MRAPGSIQIVVDELVLYGFAASDRFAAAEGVERHLKRLVGMRGLWEQLMSRLNVDFVDGGDVHLRLRHAPKQPTS